MFRSQNEFERIMMPHAGRLLRFALRLANSKPAAEDLVQETLLRAWRSFRGFKPETNARAWLFRILMNAFYEQHRKGRVAGATVSLIEADSLSTFDATHQNLEVMQALEDLSSDYRAVLMLGIVEGFSCREMSEILSIPIGTVMSRSSRARQLLREKLAPAAHMATVSSGNTTR